MCLFRFAMHHQITLLCALYRKFFVLSGLNNHRSYHGVAIMGTGPIIETLHRHAAYYILIGTLFKR